MKPAKIRLIYCGKRERGEKLLHVFVDAKGKEYSFGRLKGVWVGHAYEAEKVKDGVQISTRPKELEGERDERADEWQSLEWAAVSRQRAASARRRFEKGKDLLAEIPRLKRATKGLSYSEKRAFVEWLVDEIDREDNERRNREWNETLKRVVKRSRVSPSS